MNGLKAILAIFFFSFCLKSYSQFSLSDLKNSGIKSEEDLKNLGVSDKEISNLKKEYLQTQENTSDPEPTVKVETTTSSVENKIPISIPSKKTIPISKDYGKSIFQSGYVNLKENSDRIIPSPNYKLGTGDRISITIWGTSEFNNEFTLDQFGNINPKLVGKINLKGKSFSQSQTIIKSRFSNVYNLNTSKISIDLSFSKVISVNIVGEVNYPGTYSIPSINSAFNILSLAKGITDLGSVRNIQIRRNGKTIHTLDVYQFLNNPSEFQHYYLEDGDFIIVKPALGYVKFSGEINNPGKYEIKKNEELTDLIQYASGFSALADREAINIIRIDSNQLNFNSVSYDYALKNKLKLKIGDDINILRISNLVHGLITISGSINVPGEYEFVKGDKILDLITKAKGFNFNSYLKLAHVIRTEDDLNKKVISIDLTNVISNPKSIENIELKEFDSIKIFNKNDFLIKQQITVSGMVKNPKTINYLIGMKLKDILVEVGGMLNEADHQKIQIERVSFNKEDSSYIKIINIKSPIDDNFTLEPFDHINFRRLPQFNFQQTIEIDGEVKYPGLYSLNGKDERLSNLIERAGGITSWAFIEGAKLYRQQDSLGVLLMDLKNVLKNSKSKFNYVLKPGDKIEIPKTNDMVSISGEIGYKFINENENENLVNSPFHKGKRANFYIRKYGGGYNKNAKHGNVYVLSYNGKVKESTYFGLLKPKVNKGDKIIVDKKKAKQKKERKDPIDWNRVIENSSVKLTGILTILILVNSAFAN